MNVLQLLNFSRRLNQIHRLFTAYRDRNVGVDNLMAQHGHPDALPRYQPKHYSRIQLIYMTIYCILLYGFINLNVPASVVFGIMMWSNCGTSFFTCWWVFLNVYILLRSFAFYITKFTWPKKIMLISYMRLIFSTLDLIFSISGFVLLLLLRSNNPLADENNENGHFVCGQDFLTYILVSMIIEHMFLFFWWMMFLIITLKIFYRYGVKSSNLDIAFDNISEFDGIFVGYGVLLFLFIIKEFKKVGFETRPQIDDGIYTIPANEAEMNETLGQGLETTSHPVIQGQLAQNEITNSFQRDEMRDDISRSADRTIDLIPEIRHDPEQAYSGGTQIENQNFQSIPYPTTRRTTPCCRNLILILTSPLWLGLTFAGPNSIIIGIIWNAICGSHMFIFIWILVFNIYIILRPIFFFMRIASKKFSKSASIPIFRILFFVVDVIFVVTGIFITESNSDDTNNYASNDDSFSDFNSTCNDDSNFTFIIMLEISCTLIYLQLIIIMVIRYWCLLGFTHCWKKFHENVYMVDWLALGNGWLIFYALQDEETQPRNGLNIIPTSDQASPQILPVRVIESGPNISIPVSPITTNNPHIYNHIGDNLSCGRPLLVLGLPMTAASASSRFVLQNDECAVVGRIETDGTHELNQNHNDLNRQPRTFENNENFQDNEMPCTSQNISSIERKDISRGGIIRMDIENISQQPSTSRHGFNNRSNNRKTNENTNIENISQQPSTSRHGFNNRSYNRRKINENTNEIEMVDLSKLKSNREIQNFKKQYNEPGDEQINVNHENIETRF